ncbi:urease accessory protein UreD [Hypericibacter sp.]|uniref:urease accessory protein UreD n=1 Tax=Hypericibacter sp. TaxID=2705401 RepID=UPI003D6D0902
MPRAEGAVRLAFKRQESTTVLDRLYQQGAARVRLPNPPAGEPPLAVLLNMAGGVTGGDRLRHDIHLAPSTDAVVTSQAAERVYRSMAGEARIENRITLDSGARLDWLPQETILFDRGRLERRFTADLGAGAVLLAVEALILGRRSSGETVRQGLIQDSWRIRREGKLVFADGLRLGGDWVAKTARAAIFGNATAMATLFLVSGDAEAWLDPLRRVLRTLPCESGASAWNGMLVARFLGADGFHLRESLTAALGVLRGARLLPRTWLC